MNSSRPLLVYGLLWALCCIGIVGAIGVGRSMAAPPKPVAPVVPLTALQPPVPGSQAQPSLHAVFHSTMLANPGGTLGRRFALLQDRAPGGRG